MCGWDGGVEGGREGGYFFLTYYNFSTLQYEYYCWVRKSHSTGLVPGPKALRLVYWMGGGGGEEGEGDISANKGGNITNKTINWNARTI